MNKIERAILLLLKNKIISTDTIAYVLKLDPKYVNKKLRKLEKWGQIRRVTEQRVIYWAVKINHNNNLLVSEDC